MRIHAPKRFDARKNGLERMTVCLILPSMQLARLSGTKAGIAQIKFIDIDKPVQQVGWNYSLANGDVGLLSQFFDQAPSQLVVAMMAA